MRKLKSKVEIQTLVDDAGRYPEPRKVPTNPRWCPYAMGSPREGQAPLSGTVIRGTPNAPKHG